MTFATGSNAAVWQSWQDSATTACTSCYATNDASTWGSWIQQTSTSVTTASYVDTAITTWRVWNQQTATIAAAQSNRQFSMRATPEQLAANEAKQREVAEAKARAVKLLEENLDANQLRDFRAKDAFLLTAHGKNGEERTYRIERGISRNVKLIAPSGKVIATYCAHPDGIPAEDVMLAQKLLLDSDEEAFLRVANVS